MKRMLIIAIVLINLTTLYFWSFPYQSEADARTFQLADQALKRQTEIIGTANESYIGTIHKEVRAYPEYKSYEDKARRIHELQKESYAEIQILRDSIINQMPENYRKIFLWIEGEEDERYSLFNRLRPSQYTVPKRVFNNHLAKAAEEIKANQDTILAIMNDDDFNKLLVDSFLIDVDGLPDLLHKVSLFESMSLLSGLQSRVKIIENRALEQLIYQQRMESDGKDFNDFVPIVHANTSNLKIGDTYEAQIFAAAYSRNPYMKASVNGKEIPVKDGIATYSVTPTSIGKKKINVAMSFTNPLNKKTETFKKEFEYEVVDCD